MVERASDGKRGLQRRQRRKCERGRKVRRAAEFLRPQPSENPLTPECAWRVLSKISTDQVRRRGTWRVELTTRATRSASSWLGGGMGAPSCDGDGAPPPPPPYLNQDQRGRAMPRSGRWWGGGEHKRPKKKEARERGYLKGRIKV